MGFSKYDHEDRRFIKARRQRDDGEYRRKGRVALDRLRPSERTVRAFDQLVGDHSNHLDMRKARASNGRAKTQLVKRISRVISLMARRSPGLDFIFGTIVHEPWITFSDRTVLDLADIRQRTRNVINMCDFKGAIIMAEIQGEPGAAGDHSWPILPNVHFIAWVDPGFNKRAIGARVRESRRLSPLGQSKSIVLSKKMKAGPDLWRRICYLVKEPASAKKLHKVTGRFEGSFQNMHPSACLRMTEVLSHVNLQELLMLTGDATQHRKDFLRPISAACSDSTMHGDPEPVVARLWDNIRAKDTHFFEPIQVIRTVKKNDAKRGPRMIVADCLTGN